jgi:anti-sigma factor RsiW
VIPEPEKERQIIMYLLGDLAATDQQRFEEQLMVDDELADQLTLVEDELVDDYALGRLSEHERKRFESHFLKAPDRKRKLISDNIVRKDPP